MSRAFCYQCHRAKIACLCGRFKKIPNVIRVIVLQSPDEGSNPKGSAIIAELGLQQYQRYIAGDLKQATELNRVLEELEGQVAVLYPADTANQLNKEWVLNEGKSISCLIAIDGTWRKAKKIWTLTPQLHKLPVVKLDESRMSGYRIRKSPGEGYLSTVESIVEGLRILENRPQGFQPLLDLFEEMIDFQIEKMGEATYQKNYVDK